MSAEQLEAAFQWEDPVLQAALDKCRRTYRGPGPCYHPDYLNARRDYQRLLAKAGLLDPKIAAGL